MKSYKKLAFFLVFTLICVSALPAQAQEATRYFVKSDKLFWKKSFGVRHEFKDGFTSDLSDLELQLTKLFGLEIEPVKVLQILPADQAGATASDEPTALPKIKSGKTTAKKSSSRPVPSDQTPWGLEVIYGNPLLTRASGGADVVIGILDTGVNVDHLDLKARIAQCKDFTLATAPIVDGKCPDRNGHGTHVAGIAAADAGADGKGIYGVAPEAKLWAYKVCGDNGSCYSDDIAAAISEAADQGAQVINMSFGSDADSGLIHDAISYAAGKGVLPVAAAGNDGPFADSIDYPAAYPEVVAVGALNKSLAVTDWSSRGINSSTIPYIVEPRDIEFAAPGENIESASKTGGYVLQSGTSMASPFVAGLAAKYWQATASSPASATRDTLHTLAHDLAPLGDDNDSGFGLPQVR